MAKKDKGKMLMLLAIQFKKGLKYDNKTFLVTIREVQGDAPSIVPEALASTFKDLIEMMQRRSLDGCHKRMKWTI